MRGPVKRARVSGSIEYSPSAIFHGAIAELFRLLPLQGWVSVGCLIPPSLHQLVLEKVSKPQLSNRILIDRTPFEQPEKDHPLLSMPFFTVLPHPPKSIHHALVQSMQMVISWLGCIKLNCSELTLPSTKFSGANAS